MKLSINKKVIIIFLAFIAITNAANSQTKFVYGKTLGSEKEDYILNHAIDANGNLYIAGKTTGTIGSPNLGKNDGFLTKIDSIGKVLWTKQFGTSEDEDVQWCAIDKSANIYITGSTAGDLNGKNAGKEDVFIAKYDSDGKMLWTKQFGTDGTDVARSIYADNNGSVYVTGNTEGKFGTAAFGKADCFVLKLDKDGNQIFIKQFGTSGDDYGYCITAGAGSDILLCGSTWGDLGGKSKGLIDIFTGQFTEKGDLIKYNQFGSEGVDIAEVVNMDKEHNIYIGGMTTGNFGATQGGEGDAFLMKVNEKGDIVWNNQFGTSNNDGLRAISFGQDISDNLLVSGIMNLPPANAYIRMYNKDGKMLWEKIFVGCSGKDVKFDTFGNIYHVGLTGEDIFGNRRGGHNFYVVKLRMDKEYARK
jgi:hypothetical protein